MRCFLVELPITRNGFAMCGLWKPDSYIKTERSKNHFSFCKYNQKENGFCGLFLQNFNARELPPAYCKTDVSCCVIICRNFQSFLKVLSKS